MSVDLETRLRDYREALDAAIELDLAHDIELAATFDHELIPLARTSAQPRRKALVGVAATGLLIGGCLALLVDHRAESPESTADTATESGPDTTMVSPSASTTIPADDPTNWDPIRVAAGTVGWYEFGDIPADLASRVGAIESWTTNYTARFYRCSTYTIDADGPICTGLIGGNFVAPTDFGGTGELGTHLGDISTADLAWAKAQGSLWEYDEVTSAPPPTPIAVGDHTGLMYSNAGTSYLVWEQAPGVHLWIRASDWTVEEMVALALTVRPVTLPDHLPVPIIVDTVTTSGAPSEDELVIGSHPGMPLCAQILSSSGCVSLPPVTDVAMVVGNPGVNGGVTAVAAIFPPDSSDRLQVELEGYGPITSAAVTSPLGFQYSIFRPGTKHITAARMVAPDGSTVATATLSTVPSGPAPTTTVGAIATTSVLPTTVFPITPEPGQVHPEEGSYVIAVGDYPSTIAAKFKVRFEDLLAINGWTLVDQQVIEFPPVGTTIQIPPGWTEPAAATG